MSAPIKVAVDGRRLQDEVPGGVFRYLEGIVPRLAARPDLDIVVLCDGRRPAPRVDVPYELLRWVPGAPELSWLDGAAAPWLRRERRLFLAGFNLIPLTWSGPAVAVVYDLSWEEHPADFSAGKRWLWQRWGRHTTRVARDVVTISSFIADRIATRCGVPPDRIHIARPAVPEPPIDGGVARPAGRYVVAMGGAPRRDLPMAIEAWERARAETGRDVQLVVVGRDAPDREGIVRAGVVTDQQWFGLLRGSEALVYPTSYEGYGLPAHEAIAVGVPVVAARVGPLPEILGDTGIWADERTADGLGRALGALLQRDAAARASAREASLKQAWRLPTWDDAADVVADALHRACGRS